MGNFVVPMGIFVVLIMLFGLIYSIGIMNITPDSIVPAKAAFQTIIIVISVLMVLFTAVSLAYIKDSAVFQPYIVIVLNASLFLSLLAVSMAVIKKSS